MKINRLFEIIYILLNKKSTTAKNLAEHFEVSKRTNKLSSLFKKENTNWIDVDFSNWSNNTSD